MEGHSKSFSRHAPSLALLIVALLWGSSLVVVKDTTDSLRPNFLLGCRFTLATLILAPFAWSDLRTMTLRHWRKASMVGLFLFLAYSSQTLGVTFAPAGRSAFLSATYCVLVPFVHWAIAGRKPSRNNLLSAFLCLIGVALVARGQEGMSLQGLSLGDALALLSGFLFASHIVAVEHWGREIKPLTVTVMQFAVAAVLSWVTSFLIEDWSGQVFSSGAVMGLLYLALFCTATALFLQNWGQKRVSPATAAIILGLESVFGVVFSRLFHNEQITLLASLGFVFILAAIFLAEVKLTKKKSASH